MPPRVTVPYGPLPSQFTEVWEPTSGVSAGVAVTIHGGWWRDRHDLHLMDPLCERLSATGWRAHNLEYRRTGGDGGGWPATLEDVRSALAGVTRLAGLPLVLLGHSAGGQLALLTGPAAGADAVVGLAPVTDLDRSAAEGLGEGATADFMGRAQPGDAAYRAASPLHALPLAPRAQDSRALDSRGLAARTLVVHGDADERVPVSHSRDYVRAAGEMGAQVDYVEEPGGDHFCVIDPSHPVWSRVETWLAGLGQR